MNRQLKDTDVYIDNKKAIIQTRIKKSELLFLEALSCFDNNDKVKMNVDPYKEILVVLQRITNDYSFTSVEIFNKV